jgi:prepilin-type N-terminal cleavage/methylation domain-containing protein
METIDFRRQRRAVHPEGLTLVEVMVGMAISAICLATALQAYIGAVGIRAKSQQTDAATAKMEADAENIRQMSKETTECTGNYVQTLIGKVIALDGPSADRESSESSETRGSSASTALVARPQPFTFPSLPELPPDYRLTRKMDVDNDTPTVLRISYALTRPSHPVSNRILESAALADQGHEMEGRTVVAQLSLAVMPSAALLCP